MGEDPPDRYRVQRRRLNLIRLQQFEAFGNSEGVDLLNRTTRRSPRRWVRATLDRRNAEETLKEAVASDKVTLVELRSGLRADAVDPREGIRARKARRMLGPGIVGTLKRWMRRG